MQSDVSVFLPTGCRLHASIRQQRWLAHPSAGLKFTGCRLQIALNCHAISAQQRMQNIAHVALVVDPDARNATAASGTVLPLC